MEVSMTKNDLPTLRLLARNTSQIHYSIHGHSQMLARGYSTTDVERILTSNTNQLIEVQPPCLVRGPRFHKDPRYVISDPAFHPDTAVDIALDFSVPSSPLIWVITVEPALNAIWDKDPTKDPWLTRIGTMV